MSPQRKLRQCLHSAPSGACLRHSAWLSAAFERTLSIAISRHHDILLLIRRHSALVDILNSSLRHPRRPSHPSSQSVRRGSSRDRHQDVSFSDCLVSILWPLSDGSPTCIPAKLHDEKRFTLASGLNILISSRCDDLDENGSLHKFTKTRIERSFTHFQSFSCISTKMHYPRKFYLRV